MSAGTPTPAGCIDHLARHAQGELAPPGRVEAADRDGPRADADPAGRRDLSMVHQRDLGRPASDVDAQQGGVLALRAGHRAGSLRRQDRFQLVAGRRAHEPSATACEHPADSAAL